MEHRKQFGKSNGTYAKSVDCTCRNHGSCAWCESNRKYKDLAEIFGFATPQAIYKWQHGTAMPTLDNLVVLAAVFGVAMDDIVVIDADVKAQISA